MRRLFWLAMGATAGVLLARRVTRAAESLTPASLAHQLALGITELGEAVGDFAAEVRAGMAEREEVLVEALGITGGEEGR